MSSFATRTVIHGNRVAIGKPAQFKEKIERIIAGGPKESMVVTDFDFTLTRHSDEVSNGPKTRLCSCHKVIEDCGLLSPDYHTTAKALQAKYYPLEMDPTIPMDVKTQHMVDWVTQAHKALVESGIKRPMLKQAVAECVQNNKIQLRNGVVDFISHCEDTEIPILIYSAGIADVLEEVLRNHNTPKGNTHVHVVSNRCIFSAEDEILTDFEEPVLHVFNKKSEPFLHTPFFQMPCYPNRKHLILIGDSLGDVKMGEGIVEKLDNPNEQVLKIGFLNDFCPETGDEARYAQYLAAYDLLIFDDPSFNIIQRIFNGIAGIQGGESFEMPF